LLPLLLFAGWGLTSDQLPLGVRIQAQSFANSEWSEPVNLGAPVNSSAAEALPALSPDELSLYFASNRPGGLGGNDIWVSRRASVDDPWGPPVNLGAPVNSSAAETAPAFSPDGHLLFFSRNPGVYGLADIYVSERTNTNDDFAWGSPAALGPGVNTAQANEAAPSYFPGAEGGSGTLYFVRADPVLVYSDIFRASVTREGETETPAEVVAELSDPDPAISDFKPAVRTDGREVVFTSDRANGFGGFDLWVSTRQSPRQPWSAPVNLGVPLNTTSDDQQASLSHDGRTLVFTSNRPGGLGGNDIWVSTRTSSGR
jgi:Tol biopolymer transport system component